MGVRKLTSFMEESHPNAMIWNTAILDRSLVIDGNSLCVWIYKFKPAGLPERAVMGGPYPEFHQLVLHFFQSLAKYEVKPVVVFDGIKPDTASLRKRRKRSIDMVSMHQEGTFVSVRELPPPLMNKEVFIDVLARNPDLGDVHFVTHVEGDAAIAAIANSLGCPVLSSDSDFYVYDISGGYIPLSHIKVSDECKLTSPDVDVFKAQEFARACNLPDKDLLLLLPALVGNDHISKHSRDLAPADVIVYASQFKSLKACLESARATDPELFKNVQQAQEQYLKLPPASYPFDPTAISGPLAKLPLQYCEQFCKGNFQTFMAEAKVYQRCIFRSVYEYANSAGLQAAHGVSLPIRRSIYQILECSSPVIEIRRESNSLCDVIVEFGGQPCGTLDQTLQLSGSGRVLAKQREFVSILQCDFTRISQLSKDFQLPMLATIYWCVNAKPELDYVKSLIACFVVCHYSKFPHKFQAVYSFRTHTGITSDRESDLRFLHSLTQWQCIYYDVVALNQLLMEPFQYVSPSKLFDGELATYLYYCQKLKCMEGELTENGHELYRELLDECLHRHNAS